MERKYRSNNNIVYSCKYHVVWCPKYRRQVLVQGVDGRLKEVLREVAAETQAAIMEIEVTYPGCLPCLIHGKAASRATPLSRCSPAGGLAQIAVAGEATLPLVDEEVAQPNITRRDEGGPVTRLP